MRDSNKDDELRAHLDLLAEILDTYDESRIEVLAMEGPIGDAARGGFLARTRSKLNGLDNEAIKTAASKILAEPDLPAMIKTMKAAMEADG